MKILIVYGTTEGQTRKIADFLKTEAEKMGHKVDLADSTNNPPLPVGYEAVLIGASLHMHKYQTAVYHYVKDNVESLNKLKTGFFSVSLATESKDDHAIKELGEITEDFLNDTGWKPLSIEQVAGALLYTKYDFFKRFIMRMIAKREGRNTDIKTDYEYTDWTKVKAFLDRILNVNA
jgi:menaquinone-dependent protoporphyrinogen oxidase